MCITQLRTDRAQQIPAESGTTIKPTPVIDEVTDFVVAPIITNVLIDSDIDGNVSQFFYFFFDIYFLSLK